MEIENETINRVSELDMERQKGFPQRKLSISLSRAIESEICSSIIAHNNAGDLFTRTFHAKVSNVRRQAIFGCNARRVTRSSSTIMMLMR